MGKRIAAVGMAAVIAGGGLTVAAVNPLGIAGASSTATTQETPKTTDKAQSKHRPNRKGPLQRALAKLVEDGTLTQAQADAVLEGTKAEAKAGREHRKENRQELVAVVAEAIGSTPDEVKAGLKDGTSIAKQAEAAGVERQVVDDAVTKLFTDRIDAAVQDGKITEEQAEKAKGRLDKVVARILDADGHRLRDRAGRRGGN